MAGSSSEVPSRWQARVPSTCLRPLPSQQSCRRGLCIPKASISERRDKTEAERPHPDRKEVKTNTEIQCRNPAGIESHPEKVGHQPEATIASSPEMAARSVWGESKSRVIESRNKYDRWSLRNRSTEGSIPRLRDRKSLAWKSDRELRAGQM